MKKLFLNVAVSPSIIVSQYTHKLLFSILLLRSNHSCVCDLLENSKFLTFFSHSYWTLHYFKRMIDLISVLLLKARFLCKV